jgi:hypothetical protein
MLIAEDKRLAIALGTVILCALARLEHAQPKSSLRRCTPASQTCDLLTRMHPQPLSDTAWVPWSTASSRLMGHSNASCQITTLGESLHISANSQQLKTARSNARVSRSAN